MTTSRRTVGEAVASIRRERAEHADVIDAFHRAYYASENTHGLTFYEGRPVLKSPLDLWVYHEIIWGMKPTLIVETGSAYGASALYYARQLDLVGCGVVVSIDVEPHEALPKHRRIHWVRGSSTDGEVVDAVRQVAASHPRVMVSLDSDHAMHHVLAELDIYAPLVTPGQFCVVEDTNINGRPVDIDWHGGPGPGPAVDAWLPLHEEFERATLAERYLVTFHSWLRRVR